VRKVLVTGAAGFIGSHLVEALVRDGCRVRTLIRYNSSGRRGFLDDMPQSDETEVIAGDVRDYDLVQSAVDGCDTVYHLAALIGIPYSYISPIAYVRTNIEGTYNVLEASRRAGVSSVLITSTSETYGTAQYVPIDESHPASAQSPYAATKVAADQLALSYYRSFGLPVKVVRPFNTYGPRQSRRAIIPTIITQILSGERRLKLGSLDPTRDLTFVEDTARGFTAIAGCEECTGTATNVGSGNEVSVRDLVAFISRILGVSVEVELDEKRVRPADSEVMRLVCDSSRLQGLTGWHPVYDIETGLARTIEWFERYGSVARSTTYAV
jgi:dTDP-glucose 4,6-dehydratase